MQICRTSPKCCSKCTKVLRTGQLDVVYAVRASRQENRVKRLFYFLFYRAFVFLADSPVHVDSGDFCVMSRRAVQQLLALPEKLRFVRGLRAWLGLSSMPFPISRPARAAGNPQYSFLKLLKLAFSGLTSFSTKPLRIGFVCGGLLCFIAVAGRSFMLRWRCLQTRALQHLDFPRLLLSYFFRMD